MKWRHLINYCFLKVYSTQQVKHCWFVEHELRYKFGFFSISTRNHNQSLMSGSVRVALSFAFISSWRFGSVSRAAHYSPVGRGFESFHELHFCFCLINLFMELGSLQISTIAFPIYFNLFKLQKSEATAHCAHSTHLEVIVKAAKSNVSRAIKWLNVHRLVPDFIFTHNSAVSNYIPNCRRIGWIRPFCGRHAAAVGSHFCETILRITVESLVAHCKSNSSMIEPFLLYLSLSKSQKSVQEFLRKWH